MSLSDDHLPPCSILLLAGGRGQRMGGLDKGLVQWRGRPLIAPIHDVVRPLTDDLIISCNRNQTLYRPYADHLVVDPQADFPGPLAGVLGGLAQARHDRLLVLACDAPMIDRALLEQLILAAGPQPAVAMVRQDGQWQPMFSLIPRVLLGALQAQWQQGERSLLRALLDHGLCPVECAADDPRLCNFNTLELVQQHS
ncbi:molybdenum cofactor guanylyltransferase MobA [Pseudomonas akapageensis]|uniref:molybdenum cofactor guanylyltransferase MobA n=1 Tax=Pseudomonas akapageensis TaxID=2609961 RepID=UPI00140D49D0|nr:molybdenum cofactor guanylyltransferase MobA [Pseudomonas akapageensis]